MKTTAIVLIIIGVGCIAMPKYFRKYNTSELFGELRNVSKTEIIFKRVIGFIMLFCGLMSLVFKFK